MNNVTITKVNGGLGRREPLTDMVSGLMIGVEDTSHPIDFQLGDAVKLTSVDDAIAHGITEDLDLGLEYFVFEYIKEFFRINKNGEIYIMLFNRELLSYNVLDPNHAQGGYVKNMLIACEGKINQLGVAFNRIDPTAFDGPIDLLTVQKAQLLAEYEYEQHRPIHIILGGMGTVSPEDCLDLRVLNCPNVSVMAGQGYKSELSSAPEEMAYATNVGTVLGAISLAKVNENIAWVQKFNVEGDGFIKPFLGSSPLFPNRTMADVELMNDKGYIFFIQHAGATGVYFNDSHCACPLTSDFAYIENNRTINKASRLVRAALLPYLNSPITVNTTTGKLAPVVIKSLEAVASKTINESMFKPGELSGFTVFIDENQDILATSQLNIEISLVPTGTARQIKVNLGFTNPFNT